jgi:hypothetical protein
MLAMLIEACFVKGRKPDDIMVELLVMEPILLKKPSVMGNCSKKKS